MRLLADVYETVALMRLLDWVVGFLILWIVIRTAVRSAVEAAMRKHHHDYPPPTTIIQQHLPAEPPRYQNPSAPIPWRPAPRSQFDIVDDTEKAD